MVTLLQVAGNLKLLVIDIDDDASIGAAASAVQADGVKLYALVNNAGVGLAQPGAPKAAKDIVNTNYLGAKRVTEAFVSLIDPAEGRIVNTSSGAASMWLRKQDDATKQVYASPDTTQAALDASVNAVLATDGTEGADLGWGGYGLSKAALTALTIIHARAYPNLKVMSLSPGFIDTPMTKGFGARLSPEQGCVSLLKCLLDPTVESSYYYGSDGLRSPLTCTRDPGTPEYQGEPNPDPAVYNK